MIRCCESHGVIAPIALDDEPPRIGLSPSEAYSVDFAASPESSLSGCASPISVDETGSVFHTLMSHVIADSSTNARNQIILGVVVLMSQTGKDKTKVQ